MTSGKTIVVFDQVGTHQWTPPVGVSIVELLVVGGGGGGGSRQGGGGGGAGGLIHREKYAVDASQPIAIQVGAGGLGSPQTSLGRGESGQSSIFADLEAFGGGGGGAATTSGSESHGTNGGSGGGAGKTADTINPPGSGVEGQGYDGATFGSTNAVGGGGGGAGSPANYNNGGKGRKFDTFIEYGDNGFFASGGAGQWGWAYEGGGGRSLRAQVNTDATGGLELDSESGVGGTGGGGGGGGRSGDDPIDSDFISKAGGDGGSGIVLIAFTESLETQVSKVSGSLQVDGEPAQRVVRAFSYEAFAHNVDGEDIQAAVSLGDTTSDAATGEYEILLNEGFDQPVFIVAFDDQGQAFEAEAEVQIGDRIRPSDRNGYVYVCTTGGALPVTEPDAWPTETGVSHSIGGATFEALPFRRPMVHGPVTPTIVS